MARRAIFLMAAFLALFPAPPEAFPFEGPLHYKNQFPLFIHLDTPYIEQAALEDSFSIDISHSSIFMVRESAAWSAGLDMEATEAVFRAKKSLYDSFEIGIDVPFLSFNAGVMDAFIDNFHDTFGFPDYGRPRRPENEFLYTVKKDGATVISGEGGGVGLGDVRVTGKKALFTGDPSLSFRADIELPTGDAKKGYGNGSPDASVALLADDLVTGWLKAYGNIGAVFPGKLKANETVALRDYVFAGVALEALASEGVGFVAQAWYERSPYPKTGIKTLDRAAVLLALGARYSAKGDNLELTFVEDPSTSGAPDFSLALSYRRKF